MEVVVTWLVRLAALYLLGGLIFGIYFIFRAVGRIDPSARQTGWGFKWIILPGVIALWPLLLSRLISRQTHPPEECNAHRNAAGET